MEDSKSYTINVGKDSVTFEVKDMVWTTGVKGSIESFDKTTGKAKIYNSFISVDKLRFVNKTPENTIKNALLDVFANELALKKSKNRLGKMVKLRKVFIKKQEQLKKLGLCDNSITSQLLHEFPEMYC